MTRILATAPGKLVLLGDYAVLEGAPALVLAVDRRAVVTLESAAADYWFDAPQLGIGQAQAQLRRDANGVWRMLWPQLGEADVQALALVSAVVEGLALESVPTPFSAHLDTRAFFTGSPQSAKLGLGSSAALSVALAASIRAHDGSDTPALADLVTMHRQLQHGRGSGLDIAASCAGGMIVYRLLHDQPQLTTVLWPHALHSCCVWSGKSASTASFLQQLAQWRARHPSAFDERMAVLRTWAEQGRDAAMRGNAAALVDAVSVYARALADLGGASGIDIVCEEHRRIGNLARDCGVAYKSCGAGGGDVGVAVATDPQRLAAFAGGLAHAVPGASVVSLSDDGPPGQAPGLEVRTLH